MTKKTAYILLTCIVLLGIGLRAYHLMSRSIWFDEAFSWQLIQFPFSEIIAHVAADFHPPLYFFVLKAWAIVFGASLLSLRSFSITMAAATIAALYLYSTAAWRSRTAGIVAALLFAVSGWQIAFSWDVRMYTMGTFFAALSTFFLLRSIRQKNQKPWWWFVYGLAATAFLYTHYYAIFSVAAQAIFIIGYIIVSTRGRIGEMLHNRVLWHALLAGLTMTLLFAPWLPYFLQQRAQFQQDYWIPKIGGWVIPDTFYRMVVPTPDIPNHHGFGAIVTALPISIIFLGLIFLVLGCFRRSRGSRVKMLTNQCDAVWLTVTCFLLPFLFSIAQSVISQSLYLDRYFLFANIYLFAVFAGLVMKLKRPRLIALASIVTAAMLLSFFVSNRRALAIETKPGAHAAAQYLFSHRAVNEPVYASSPYIFFPLVYYAKEEFQNAVVPKLYTETGVISRFSGLAVLTTNDTVGQEIFGNQAPTSFWLVETTGFGESELKVPRSFKRIDHQVFDEVYDYQKEIIVNHYQR